MAENLNPERGVVLILSDFVTDLWHFSSRRGVSKMIRLMFENPGKSYLINNEKKEQSRASSAADTKCREKFQQDQTEQGCQSNLCLIDFNFIKLS